MAFLDRCLQFFVVFLTVFLIPSEAEITDVLLPLNDTVTLNFSDTCHNGKPHVTYFFGSTILNDSIKESRGLKTNVSSTNCCPANVNAEITVPGIPLNNGVEIGIQNFCGNNISAKESSHWSIILQGISPVEDIQWSIDDQTLSWCRPSFYSDDVQQGAVPTYNVLVNGISVTNTTDTSAKLNVSCVVEFNVSIVASVGAYQSTKTITILNNNYSVELLNHPVFYNSTEGTVSLNITFQAKSSLGVCGFEYFIYIISENESVKNYTYMYSTQEPPPLNKKQVTISETVHNLKLDHTYTVDVSLNLTKDILNFTISTDRADVISASPTISSTSPPHSLFSSFSAFSSTSSYAGQSSEASNFFLTSSRYRETSPGSSDVEILEKVIPSVVAVAVVLFTAVLMVIGCLIYYHYKRKNVSHSDEENPEVVSIHSDEENPEVVSIHSDEENPEVVSIHSDEENPEVLRLTRIPSLVFESNETVENLCEYSNDDSNNNTTLSESLAPEAPYSPPTDPAAESSGPEDLEYSSSFPSSGHTEILHTQTSSLHTGSMHAAPEAKTGITNSQSSSFNISGSDKYPKTN